MGIKNALPPRESLVDFFAAEIAELHAGGDVDGAGTGRYQLEANRWALARGGHVRTGLEDNIFYEQAAGSRRPTPSWSRVLRTSAPTTTGIRHRRPRRVSCSSCRCAQRVRMAEPHTGACTRD